MLEGEELLAFVRIKDTLGKLACGGKIGCLWGAAMHTNGSEVGTCCLLTIQRDDESDKPTFSFISDAFFSGNELVKDCMDARGFRNWFQRVFDLCPSLNEKQMQLVLNEMKTRKNKYVGENYIARTARFSFQNAERDVESINADLKKQKEAKKADAFRIAEDLKMQLDVQGLTIVSKTEKRNGIELNETN